MLPVNPPMFEVADDALVALTFFQRLATLDESLPGRGVALQIREEPAERARLAFAVRGEPDVGHATAGDQFVQLKFAERSGAGRNRSTGFFEQT